MLGRALATDGKEVLVVGGYFHEPCPTPPRGDEGAPGEICDYSPITWISDDGATWTAGYPDSVTGEFVAAWPAASGGWDAASSTWYGDCLGGQDLWHSDDGLAWAQLTPSPPAPWEGYDPGVPVGIASASGRSLLAASERGGDGTTLSTREDGGSWTVLEDFPGQGVLVWAGVPPVGGMTRWVLGGGQGPLEGPTVPVAWSSEDLVSWKATRLSVHPSSIPWSEGGAVVTAVNALVVTERGYVAVGAAMDTGLAGAADASVASHETWVSDDAITWIQLPGAGRPMLDFGPGLLADGPAGVIGVGSTHTDGESAVWQLR
jgi:hypothetical protein